MKLSEKEIMYIINETKTLLTEDQESDSIKKAIAFVVSQSKMDYEEAEKWVRLDLRSKYPALRNKRGGKFILGTARFEIHRDLIGHEDVMNDIIDYISINRDGKKNDYYNLFDKNFNGLSIKSLLIMFEHQIDTEYQQKKNELEQNFKSDTANNEYTIVPIKNFEEASNYSQYTSWCVTKTKEAFMKYTKNMTCQFYFCLRQGFENVQPIQGENSPLDEYGLSMLAICVLPNGKLKTCTCRWNHSNGGNDNVMDSEEISKLFGTNFHVLFKPNAQWKDELNNLKKLLAENIPLKDIFDSVSRSESGYVRCEKNDMYFIITPDRKILGDVYFDYISPFSMVSNDIFDVTYMGRNMLLTKDGKLTTLSSIIHTTIEKCREYERKGEDIPLSLFTDTYQMLNGDIRVSIYGYKNIITNGKLLFDTFFQTLYDTKMKDKTYYVCRHTYNDYYALLDSKGNNILKDCQLQEITRVSEDGCIVFKNDNDQYNALNISNTKKILSKKYFKFPPTLIVRNNKYYFIGVPIDKEINKVNCYTSEGVALFEIDVDSVVLVVKEEFLFFVKNNDKYNIISNDGKLMLDEWYDDIEHHSFIRNNDTVRIKQGDKMNYFSLEMKRILSPKWFDDGEKFYGGDNAVVKIGEKSNLLTKYGELILPKWFTSVEEKFGCVVCYEESEGYYIYTTYKRQMYNDKPFYSVKFDGIYLCIKENEDSEEIVKSAFDINYIHGM